jgi:hypothetical protein
MPDDTERDDGKPWGHIVDGQWWPLPKLPLLRAGLGPPPFKVTLPDQRVREVVHPPGS